MNKPRPKNLEEALAPVTDMVGDGHWLDSRAFFLSGAGVSMAVLLVVIQVAGQSPAFSLNAAACFAAIAVPIWLALAQMSDTTLFWKDRGLEHSKNAKLLLAQVIALGCAGGALFVSVLLLLFYVSWLAAVLLVVVSLISALVAFWHADAVKKYVEREGG